MLLGPQARPSSPEPPADQRRQSEGELSECSISAPALPSRATWVAAGLAALLITFGCERKEPVPAKSLDAPSRSVSKDRPPAESKSSVFTLEYDLPLLCPVGQEFVAADSPSRLSAEQRTIINAAHYLWRQAVGENARERDDLARKIAVLPNLSQMPPDSPFLGPVRAALEPLGLKAAYVQGVVEFEDIHTHKPGWTPFRFFSFEHVTAESSFFATVDALGHEFRHAKQGENDKLTPEMSVRFQETARREAEAYAQGAADLRAVAKYLRTSPAIDASLRARNLDAWLTDIGGQIYGSERYSARFLLQYQAAATDTSLQRISEYLSKAGVSKYTADFQAFRQNLAGLLAYEQTIKIDPEGLKKTVSHLAAYISSIPELAPADNPAIGQKTDQFLKLLHEFEASVDPYVSACKRLEDWNQRPAPFREN